MHTLNSLVKFRTPGLEREGVRHDAQIVSRSEGTLPKPRKVALHRCLLPGVVGLEPNQRDESKRFGRFTVPGVRKEDVQGA